MSLNLRRILLLVLALLLPAVAATSQPWRSIVSPDRAIDWSGAGVGTLPPRPDVCARLSPSASVTDINAALAACPKEKAVFLEPGTYTIAGTITVPSNVTLRGAGADRTILNATGAAGGEVITLGMGAARYIPLRIANGATDGSSAVELADPYPISAGMFLVITENNDPAFVSSLGSEGNCNWCDGGWSPSGAMARGQIVQVTGAAGHTVRFTPGLFGAYTKAPVAVPFSMAARFAGVEDLQVRANNTGYSANFSMSMCAYCWIKGVESNYTDGDHVTITWGYHDEVRDSYFSNAYLHQPGLSDSDIRIALKTTASLVENNIIERTHVSLMLQWGAAGNVIAYNYMMGEFDSGAPNVVIGGVDFHGAHPQFNLLEGNVLTLIYADSIWGSSSHTTAFRNWVIGTNRVCSPLKGRGDVNCSGTNSRYGFQAARAVNVSYLSTRNNFVGNIIGSAQIKSLRAYGNPLAQISSIEYPSQRSYDAVAYGWSFGYGEASDAGPSTACGASQPCHLAGIAAKQFLHGNFTATAAATAWMDGVDRTLPASFYLSAKPEWWGTMPFPSTGPDLSGGEGPEGHSYGNPARACYLGVMGGSDGGQGSPRTFNAAACYSRASR